MFPTQTGVTRCLAQPRVGAPQQQKADPTATTTPPSASQHRPTHPSALHHPRSRIPLLSSDHIRATHKSSQVCTPQNSKSTRPTTHARPLNPEALASVPPGILLVRVRSQLYPSARWGLSLCQFYWHVVMCYRSDLGLRLPSRSAPSPHLELLPWGVIAAPGYSPSSGPLIFPLDPHASPCGFDAWSDITWGY
jgi:hypothetical protein